MESDDEDGHNRKYVKGAVDISKLFLLVILQCHVANDVDVAECFYDIANPGFFDEDREEKPEISAGQKELGDAFKHMCSLVSKQLIYYYTNFDDNGVDKYDEGDYESLEEAIEELKDDWIDTLFDTECELDFEAFVDKCCKKDISWVFNS